MNAQLVRAMLRALPTTSTHHDVERLLREAGWAVCGVGDWAFALAAPDGNLVARISPFDPVGRYTARLYREAATTGQVPRLTAHRQLAGGGDLQIMDRLTAVPTSEASALLTRLAKPEPELKTLADVVVRVHRDAQRDLPWCGPLDQNPSNIMRGRAGALILTDPYYADGPNLYATAERDPDAFVARLPENQRRFMTEIPLAHSGPWSLAEREALREKLRRADDSRAQRSIGRG